MEQRNEPKTAEIVRALRCDGDANNCVDCRYATYDTATILCDQEQNVRDAADRLEQLERDLETFKAFHERYAEQTSKKYVEDICALTARAEQAERERDLSIKALTEYEDALYPTVEEIMGEFKQKDRRGLPQDGEGK